MKRKRVVITVACLSAVFILAANHRNRELPTTSSRPAQGTSPEKPLLAKDLKLEMDPQKEAELSQLESSLEMESIKVGQIDEAPERTTQELAAWAKSLNGRKLELLKQKAIDSKNSGDERSLAVFLLTQAAVNQDKAVNGDNNSQLAQKQLSKLALTPIEQSLEDRQFSFEEALRAQALDAVSKSTDTKWARQVLEQIKSTTNSSFLNLRANQNLSFLSGNAGALDQQDHQVLDQMTGSKKQETR